LSNPVLQKAIAERVKHAIDEALALKKFRSLNALAQEAHVDRTQLDRFLKQKQGMNAADFLSVCRVLGMELTETVQDVRDAASGETIGRSSPETWVPAGAYVGTVVGTATDAYSVYPHLHAVAKAATEPSLTPPIPGQEQNPRERFEADLDPMEVVVWRGKEMGLSNSEIARLLNKGKNLVDEISQHLYRRWDKMSGSPSHQE